MLCGLAEVAGVKSLWCQPTWPHILEDSNLHGHHCENLKWHRMVWHFREWILEKQVEVKYLSNAALRSLVVVILPQITMYETLLVLLQVLKFSFCSFSFCDRLEGKGSWTVQSWGFSNHFLMEVIVLLLIDQLIDFIIFCWILYRFNNHGYRIHHTCTIIFKLFILDIYTVF
jgi:hypothetical protein